ncbi:Ig-like domain-containing protein [Sphaerospermopsis sp. LEGE 08334]|uniref:Ig-like domain-containing protein n=1 Tax=Sphaerospermopsis sp. LEGE 08334 TaxID=1828651 RepID=UPI00187FCE98|nr:Ig-like domain-containing protein [Sphaerospermopsis sp. LEGE 08334]MBE9059207.1 Ig-like domain-containing protein [Sphaerospermopsis sp. LEGE 08334]
MNILLNSALPIIYNQLINFANKNKFWQVFDTAFGTQYNRSLAEIMRLQWETGDFSQLPQIEVLDSSILGGANGAYASSINKIYLSNTFVAAASLAAISGVLLEEIGHFVDAKINQTDSAGDEGAIFAALVQGQGLDVETLRVLKAEDDHSIITLNGQSIPVEQQNFTGTDGNDTITGSSEDDTINPLRGQDTVDGGAGNDLLILDYSSNDYYSGINSSISSNGNGGFNGNYQTGWYFYDQVSFSNIERFQITGTTVGDSIVTGDGNDTINSGAGDDTIYAGTGINIIDGGDGIDTLTDADFSSATTAITINDSNNPTITVPDGTSVTNIEKFINVSTGSGNDLISFTQRLNNTVSTGDGDDTINAGLGQDTVDGGAGNDLLILDYSSNDYYSGINSSISSNGNGGFNGNYQTGWYFYDQVSFSNIERFQITGTTVGDSIVTGGGNDTINGGAGNDTINAGDGNDTINGVNEASLTPGLGEIDILAGGAGSDIFILGNATKAYYEDGNTLNNGSNDYADITDFNIGDIIQLQGTSSNYLLAVVGADTQILINKPNTEPDELIGIVRNQTGLSLTGSNFAYVALPTITLAVSPSSVQEDGTTNLVYTFTRTGSTANALTVNYGITGTAGSSDYTGATPGTGKTITFTAGSSTRTLTIDPTADTTVENNETVILTLAAGSGYTVGTTSGVTGTITNDDIQDTTPPLATSLTPTDNATGVAVNANLVVNFNEAIQKGTGNIFIKKVSDNSTVETIAVTNSNVTISGTQLTINPTNDLASGTGYYVQIANTAIRDLASNNYAGFPNSTTTWRFTTNKAPTGLNFPNNVVKENVNPGTLSKSAGKFITM